MTRYYKVDCPRCEGSGKLRKLMIFDRPCPMCHGSGLVTDYEHPIEMMPQPEAELSMVRPRPTAELLAETLPLGRKTTVSLLPPRPGLIRRRQPTHRLLSEQYHPLAGMHYTHEKQPSGHDEAFVEGAAPDPHNFVARMRQR